MKQIDFGGKWALVTGAGSGMGRTLALDLAREGANLLLVDINGEVLGKVALEAEALGAETHTYCADLTSWEEVRRMADSIHARWGAVDILANCAGIAHMCHTVDTPVEDWQRLLAVNLWTIIHTVKAFAPEMMRRKSGQIVNISSGQAFFAVPTWGPYACTKFAVDGYSEALRYELFWHGVGVTTVFPGVVRTPVLRLDNGRFPGARGHEAPDGNGGEARGAEPSDGKGDKEAEEAGHTGHHVARLPVQEAAAVAVRGDGPRGSLGSEGRGGHVLLPARQRMRGPGRA